MSDTREHPIRSSMSNANPTLLVMAAGMGSRYGGLKQLEQFGPSGETLLDYSVYDAIRAGFNRVVFVIRRDFEAVFREKVGAKFADRIDVDYVFQELDKLPSGFQIPPEREKPWGTGHAVWCAADVVKASFAAINADDFYGRDALAQMGRFLSNTGNADASPARYSMAGYRLADTLSEHGTVSRGVCEIDDAGRLVGINEVTAIASAGDGNGRTTDPEGREQALSGETIVSMNCWGFPASVFGLLDDGLREFLAQNIADPKAEFYLPAAVAEGVGRNEVIVDVLPVRSSWFGVTHRDDNPRVIEALAGLVASGEYPSNLWE